MRRQEAVDKKPQCFKCGEEGHKKWKCPQRRKRRREEVALLHEVWEKVKEHSRVRGLSSRGAAMCMEGWTTPRKGVTFVECRGCEYKGTKTKENKGQCFLSKEQKCNMWCGCCKEAWNWRIEKPKRKKQRR